MRIVVTPNTRDRGPLAEAEILFDSSEGVLEGLKLAGFSIWKGKDGPYVKLPGRQYQDRDGKPKSFDFLRSQNRDDLQTIDELRAAILAEYQTK